MKSPVLTFLFSLALITSAQAEDPFIETSQLGTTDWVEGYVEATGQGTSRYMGNRIQEELMAKQAARTVAQARLLEIVKGVRITGLTTIGAQAQGDTRAATRIKGTLRGAKTVDEKATWHKDDTSRRGEVVMAEVTLRLCVSPACTETKDNLTEASLNIKPQASQNTEHSAVIIDLNQALYLPALAPEIIDESNRLIYSQEILAENASQIKGLVHYAKTIAKARALNIAGPSPMVITAKRITADNRIVISKKDADTLQSLPAIKQGHLIVALD